MERELYPEIVSALFQDNFQRQPELDGYDAGAGPSVQALVELSRPMWEAVVACAERGTLVARPLADFAALEPPETKAWMERRSIEARQAAEHRRKMAAEAKEARDHELAAKAIQRAKADADKRKAAYAQMAAASVYRRHRNQNRANNLMRRVQRLTATVEWHEKQAKTLAGWHKEKAKALRAALADAVAAYAAEIATPERYIEEALRTPFVPQNFRLTVAELKAAWELLPAYGFLERNRMEWVHYRTRTHFTFSQANQTTFWLEYRP